MKIIKEQTYYKISEIRDITKRSKQAIYKIIEKINIENIDHVYINNVLYVHQDFIKEIEKMRAENRQK